MTPTRIVLPLRRPLSTSQGPITERRGVLLTRPVARGTALAEATPHPDLSATDPEALYRSLVDEVETAPPEAAAVTAWLDLDAAARDRDLPAAALLSADPTPSVALNGLVGIGEGPEVAVRIAAGGFTTIKVKVGDDPDEAFDRLAAIRRVVGPGVSLRADANGAWDTATAMAALQMLSPLDLEYVEDPIDDDADWSSLIASPVPLAVDTGEPSEVQLEAVSVVVLKPVMHPPRRVMEQAERARDHGADVVVTSIVDGAAGVGASLQIAAALGVTRACGLATSRLLAADLSDPPPIRDGSMWLGRPGVGVVLNARRLDQVSVTSFSNVSNG